MGVGDCAKGYQGVMCGVCSAGYYLSSGGSSCLPCTGSRSISSGQITLIAFVISMLGVALLVSRYYANRQLDVSIREVLLPEGVEAGEAAKKVPLEDILLMKKLTLDRDFSILMNKWTPRLKILISTYQIVLTSSNTYRINLGPIFSQFISSITFLNLDFVKLLPVQCYTKFSYIPSMEATTISPLVLAVFIGICCMLQSAFVSLRAAYHNSSSSSSLGGVEIDVAEETKRLRIQYFSYVVMIFYLILPGVAIKVFRTLDCLNVDPFNEDLTPGLSHLYLRADLDVDCTSSAYVQGRNVAYIMILVYPVGLPLLYFYLLYSSRQKIKKRPFTLPPITLNTIRNVPKKSIVDSIGFLFLSYKPQYW